MAVGILASTTTDIFETNNGQVAITFVGHASLYITYNNQIIHIDPFSRMGDYDNMPKADLILLTHHHQDHLDTVAISKIRKDQTAFIVAPICTTLVNFDHNTTIIGNGESAEFNSIFIEAVPAYNIVSKRENGTPYHPKGEGNGYILSFDDLRIYIAGDTENIPEMKDLGHVDIAFLPMNQPFTMTPEQTAAAARMIKPKVLFPYHYGNTDTNLLKDILNDDPIEIRIR